MMRGIAHAVKAGMKASLVTEVRLEAGCTRDEAVSTVRAAWNEAAWNAQQVDQSEAEYTVFLDKTRNEATEKARALVSKRQTLLMNHMDPQR